MENDSGLAGFIVGIGMMFIFFGGVIYLIKNDHLTISTDTKKCRLYREEILQKPNGEYEIIELCAEIIK